MAKKPTGKLQSTSSSTRKINRFNVSRAASAIFKGEGLRSFFTYRDLGIKTATGGRIGAHVIRATRACSEGTGAHKHVLGFQFVYVLKGRVAFWYDGHGKVVLGPGDCVHMPPEIHHQLIEGSSDLEMLEITSPATFATLDVKRVSSKTVNTSKTAKPTATLRAKARARHRANMVGDRATRAKAA